MCADTGIQTYAIDDLRRIQALRLRISIQLIKIGNAKGEIGIGKKFYSFRLSEAHKQSIDILFNGTLLKESGKCMCSFCRLLITGYNDPAWIQIIIQRLGFTKKFRTEDDIFGMVFFSYRCSEAHRDGGFNDHHRVRICF